MKETFQIDAEITCLVLFTDILKLPIRWVNTKHKNKHMPSTLK